MRESEDTPFRSTLLVVILSFVFAGAAFAAAPRFTLQSTCSGPVNGGWTYSSKENGSCTCPTSIPLPNFNPAYEINVCQNVNNLSGSVQGQIQLHGTVSGSQVNFTTVTNFSVNQSGVSIKDKLTDTNHGTLQGNSISGNVTSNWSVSASVGGTNVSCGCSLSGTFKVQLTGGSGGGGGGGGSSNPPKVNDVSQISGIAKQSVATTGVQWTDINGDGKPDLILVGSNNSALFKNVGAGHFSNASAASKLSSIVSNGAAWADFDNDGKPDAVFFNTSGLITFAKNVNGVLTPTASKPAYLSPGSLTTGTPVGGIWFDYDNDGLVDAYIIKNGGANQLFKNEGNGHFTDEASAAHVNFSGPGRSAVSADFNGDGFPDLYVANFHAPNKLFINNGGGTFRTVSGAAFAGASVLAIVGDYNNDKRLDILVVNSGGPSVLFKNTGNDASGNPKFVKVNAGISSATRGIAAAFGDFNNDGFMDMLIIQSTGGNILFQGNGTGTFSAVSSVNLNNPTDPTGTTIADYNTSGLLSFMIGDRGTGQTGGDSLYQNVSQKNHWIEITLKGTQSNRSAIGAIVTSKTGTTFQERVVSGGNGHDQDSLVVHFGLGTSTKVDELDILWPSGVVQHCLNVNADRKVSITEGSASNLGCQ